ncbi:MAG TPA: uroporphyrinogen-III synthase [Candidatus Eisenbacteria bacterium]
MSDARPLLVIARHDPADASLAREAEARGIEVFRVALFETRPGAQVEAFDEWLDAPAPGSAIAWTSRRAASVLAAIDSPERRESLRRLPLFAVGQESAGPLADAGFAVETPKSGLGAAHLAAHVIDRAPALGVRRVAFLHGDRALPDLPEALARAGLPVMRFEVYRTVFRTADVTPLVNAVAEERPCALVAMSPSGIAGLERLLSSDAQARLHADAIAIARGGTTYQALLRWGYAQAVRPMGDACASFDAFVLDTLQSFARNTR